MVAYERRQAVTRLSCSVFTAIFFSSFYMAVNTAQTHSNTPVSPEGSPHNFAVSAQRTPNAAEKNACCWRRRPKASINGSNHSSRIVGMA